MPFKVALDENVLFPTTGGLRIACKLWQVEGLPLSEHDVKLICYPGWLDNAGSFDNCAEILCREYGFAIVAIDPPGCGHSDHRPRSAIYNDYEEPPLIADIADALGWDTFGLIGHSRGAGVCSCAAGLLRDRVKVFVCVDSHYALSGLWFDDMGPNRPTAPQRMQRARDMAKKNLERPARVFSSLQEAVDANKNNPSFRKSESTARNIVRRHTRPAPGGGVTFTHDVRTYGQTQYLHMSESHLNEFLSSITAPVMQMLDMSRWKMIPRVDEAYWEKMTSRNKLLKGGVTVVHMDKKGHHFHSDAAAEFCEIVGPWIIEHYKGIQMIEDQGSTVVPKGPKEQEIVHSVPHTKEGFASNVSIVKPLEDVLLVSCLPWTQIPDIYSNTGQV